MGRGGVFAGANKPFRLRVIKRNDWGLFQVFRKITNWRNETPAGHCQGPKLAVFKGFCGYLIKYRCKMLYNLVKISKLR